MTEIISESEYVIVEIRGGAGMRLRRQLCVTGQELLNQWLDALDTHDPEAIFRATRNYFFHINGVKHKNRCGQCEWVRA